MMTREQARAFVKLYAATEENPALTDDRVESILDQSRIVDVLGRRIIDPGYLETFWGTRAVVLALDAKLAMAMSKVDLVADGTQVSASQITEHLLAQRRSWRSRMISGSA
jgi:hypothetical protein